MPIRCPQPNLVSNVTPAVLPTGLTLPPPTLFGGPAAMPRGGNPALRGPKPYSPRSWNATVAAPYNQAAIDAARAAGGAGGNILLPHAGSPYSGVVLNLTVGGQYWQLAQANTIFSGPVNVLAPSCTIEGGVWAQTVTLVGTGTGDLFTARNFTRTGAGRAFLNEHKNGTLLSQFEWTGTGGLIDTFYTGVGQTVDGIRIEHGISSAGFIAHGPDGGDSGPNTIKNVVIHNTWMKASTGTQFFACVEVFHHIPNAQGDGMIVEYSEIGGGSVVLSIVGGSRASRIRNNKIDITVAFSGAENAGNQQVGTIYEDNEFIGVAGQQRGWGLYHNSSAHNNTVHRNKFTNLSRAIGGFPDAGGGGYTVDENCISNVGALIDSGYGIPNVIGTNNPTVCGF